MEQLAQSIAQEIGAWIEAEGMDLDEFLADEPMVREAVFDTLADHDLPEGIDPFDDDTFDAIRRQVVAELTPLPPAREGIDHDHA